MGFVATIVVALSCTGLATAQPATSAADRVQALIDAGKLERAEALLSGDAVPAVLRPRFRGLVALRRGRPETAIDHFRKALELTPGQPHVKLYLAHAQLESGDARAALAALKGTESLASSVLAQPLLAARVHRALDQPEAAYRVLRRAVAAFPKQPLPALELLQLSAASELRGAARQWAERLLELELDRDHALAAVHALYRDGDAAPLIESILARFPRDAELRGHAAHGYARWGQHYAAGRLFEEATALGGRYAFEAADQYRLAGAHRAALALNARVESQHRRLPQRLEILFGADRMARVVALERAVTRAGLLAGSTRYRVAYAHYRLGHFDRASTLARSLVGGELDGQARSLLSAMGRE